MQGAQVQPLISELGPQMTFSTPKIKEKEAYLNDSIYMTFWEKKHNYAGTEIRLGCQGH